MSSFRCTNKVRMLLIKKSIYGQNWVFQYDNNTLFETGAKLPQTQDFHAYQCSILLLNKSLMLLVLK